MPIDAQAARRELVNRGFMGYLEPALTMASSIVAEPVSGFAGMAAMPFVGADRAGDVVRGIQEDMTYQPRSVEGAGAMESIGSALAPIADAMEGGAKYLGDKAYDVTGSPALAAAAYSAPTAALEAMGLGVARKAGRAGKLGKQFEVGDIDSQGIGKQRGIFAGVKAKGADLKQQQAAQELARRGIGRDEIWQKTGWFEDVDGGWKWEIDDSGAKIKGNERDWNAEILKSYEMEGVAGKQMRQAIMQSKRDYNPPHEMSGTVLSQVIDHPDLFDAYRDAKAIGYERSHDMSLGDAYYEPRRDTVTVSALNKDAVRSPLLHETQHAIQEREGFAKGGNIREMERGDVNMTTRESEALKNKIDNVLQSDDFKADKAALRAEGMKRHDVTAALYEKYGINEATDRLYEIEDSLSGLTSFDKYERLAGEAEARNVQTRMNYTPEERRAKAPWTTLDVPEDELIVRGSSGGKAMSEGVDYENMPFKERVALAKQLKTGDKTDLFYTRNTESSKNYPTGMDFGQKVEPAGRYMNVDLAESALTGGDGWEMGKVSFKNPIVLDHKSTSSTGWKKDLSEMFGGKTGKALTREIKKAGYDGIITRDDYGFNETVDLTGSK